MQLIYGDYEFPVNGTQIGSSTDTIMNEGGVPYKLRQTISVSGFLLVDGQTDAALQESALRTALAIPYGELDFLQDDGAPTPLGLTNVGSITGVRCTKLRFPTTDRGEYVTIRSFECEFEAEYGLVTAALSPFAALVNFSETLAFEGGAPIFRHQLAMEGDNLKLLVYPMDTFRATQSGQCTGRLKPHVAPAPIWPTALKQAPQFTRSSPQLQGAEFEGYGLTWHYEYESVSALIGFPNLWPG